MKKFLLWTLIVAFCLSALFGIVLFLFGLSFSQTEGQILATTICLGIYSVAGFCQSFIFGRANKYLSYAGFGVTILSYLSIVMLIWFGSYIPHMDLAFKIVVIGVLFTVFATHASLMSLINTNNRVTRKVQSGTIAFSLLATLVTDYEILFNRDNYSSGIPFLVRLIAVFIILAVLGTLVTPILHKLTKKNTLE